MDFCVPCLFGLEGIVADELKRMDASRVQAQNGKVLFSGDEKLLARANIRSRCAERILLVTGQFRAVTFDSLFEQVKALPWEQWIGKTDRFPVKGWSLNSTLHSVPDCQAIIKKAIVERLKSRYGISWFEETGVLYQVQFTIMKDDVTVMIDTSGAGLHKRGYRAHAGGAPLKETLAAAMVDLSKARLAQQVLDPCCGSGTLLIEAALAARRIAPGIRRRFVSMEWPWIPASVWKQERLEAKAMELTDREFAAIGGDVDSQAVALAIENAEKAGVGRFLTANVADIANFRPEGDSGVVLCNPPYGERLLDVQQAEDLYRQMGRVFVPKKGWTYGIISPHEQFESLFGRPADKRRKLYNGMLKCQFYLYYG